jgi:hypothetical protein
MTSTVTQLDNIRSLDQGKARMEASKEIWVQPPQPDRRVSVGVYFPDETDDTVRYVRCDIFDEVMDELERLRAASFDRRAG